MTETISQCWALKGDTKATIRGKKSGTAVKSLATTLHFWSHCPLICNVNGEKAKVLLMVALSQAWIQAYIFPHSVCGSMRGITWEPPFCFWRQLLVLFGTDLGRWDHEEQASDECGDNKRPPALSSLLFQSKTMEGERDWFNQLHHLEYSTPCRSISSVNITDETLCVAQSRRVTSNYRGRSPLNWGLFHPHKLLVRRLTVTFRRSENWARHIV